MKSRIKLLIPILSVMVLVSCSADSSDDSQLPNNPNGENPNGNNGENPDGNNGGTGSDIYFGFLDGDGSSNEFIDMPIESSPTDLLIGRWKIVRLGIDENNDGNIVYYNYEDFDHEDCGTSFLQFNNNGIAFENSYYKNNGTCTLYSEIDNYEFIEENRMKIYVYDIIYLIKLTETELILKYDWAFENSLWGPMQVYYYYERIEATN